MSSPARRALAASLLLALLAPATPAAAAAPVAPLPPPLVLGGVRQQVVASDGSLWYGTYDAEVVRVGEGGAVRLAMPSGTTRAVGTHLEPGVAGSIWTRVDVPWPGRGSGLAELRPDGSSRVVWLPSSGSDRFTLDGSDLVLHAGDDLLRIAEDGSTTTVPLPFEMTTWMGLLQTLESDPRGGVWLGTRAGLWRLDGTAVTRVHAVGQWVDEIEAVDGGPVWLDLRDGVSHLARLDPATGAVEHLPQLPPEVNPELAADDAGTLWMLSAEAGPGGDLAPTLVAHQRDGRTRRLLLGEWGHGLAAGPAGAVWYAPGDVSVSHRIDTTKPFTALTAVLATDRHGLDLQGRHEDGRPLRGPVTVRWSPTGPTTTASLGPDGAARVPLPPTTGRSTLQPTVEVAETAAASGATARPFTVEVPDLSVELVGPAARPGLYLYSLALPGSGTVTLEVDGTPRPAVHHRGMGATSMPLDLPPGRHRLVVRLTPHEPGWAAVESPPLDVDLSPHLDRYITRVYDELLGRLPDPGGLAYWRGLLATGTPRAAVASALSTAPEYRAAMVADTYGWVLGRAPDPAGHAYWTSRLLDGWTVQRLEGELYGSAEYYAVAGGTHEAFVTALYADVLGRAVDHGGFGYHVQRLRRGTPPRDLAASLVTSEEALRLVVDAHYGWFLGRTADEGGLRYWVGQILAGHREEGIVALLIGSDEYFAAS